MASVCGGTLGLMDAGVPIGAPVAGISIGLVSGANGEYRLLTDIQGAEDHFGDMDFKVAGTRNGVTGVQVDIKVKHLTAAQVDGAFARAREARMQILEVIGSALAAPRDEVAEFAPKLIRTSIPQDAIGSLIGPGGKTIRRLEEESGATIEVEEDGTVMVAAPTKVGVDRVVQMVRDLTGQIDIGRALLCKVTRIFGFGAMVEIVPGREGLVPRHELAEEPVGMIEDVVNVDDDIMVKVIEIDDQGRINLSRRAVLLDLTPEETLASARPAPRPPRRDGGRGREGGPRRDGRGDRGRNDGPPRRRPRRYE
jgi:polyribonucleotide nucleotidyltransferase